MAKGFGSRGMGGMGGGMNMNMIKQAQKMQQDMMRMQQELEEKTYEASAGGVGFFCLGREKKPPKDEGPGRQKSSGAAEGHASAAAFGTSNIKFFLPTFSFKKK